MSNGSYGESFAKWSEWCKKNSFECSSRSIDENKWTITLSGQTARITIPGNYTKGCDDTLLFESVTESPLITTAVSVTNMCARKHPSVVALLKKFTNVFYDKKQTLGDSVETSMRDALKIDMFEVDLDRLEQKLIANMASNKSMVSSGAQVPKLFSKENAGRIIIREYLKTLRKFRSSASTNVSLVDENIYQWRIKMRNFASTELVSEMKESNNEWIVVDLNLHDTLHPTHPPMIKSVSPKLDISYRLSQINMTKLEYWSPSTSMIDVIEKIYAIVDKNAHVKKGENKVFTKLEQDLLKLAALHDMNQEEDNLDTDTYTLMFSKESSNTKKSMSGRTITHGSGTWKKGIGFGNSGNASTWTQAEYEKIQEEKAKQTNHTLMSIIQEIDKYESNPQELYDTLAETQLSRFLTLTIGGATLTEVDKKLELFKSVLMITSLITKIECMPLFEKKYAGMTLVDALTKLSDQAKISMKLADEDQAFAARIVQSAAIVKSLYDEYRLQVAAYEKKVEEEKKAVDDLKIKYVAEFNKNIVDEGDINNPGYRYYGKVKQPSGNTMKKLSIEIAGMVASTEINWGSSIILRYDKNNICAMRALITGPPDTPYDNGIFIFDIAALPNYPTELPLVNHVNNDGTRFNPNLYACGKVCLSLLGTWGGGSGETWDPKTSSIIQLLKSIQSLILVEEPCFNEPGHERNYGSDAGNKENAGYNQNVQFYTMRTSMLNMLKNIDKQYPEFKDMILFHFKSKKDEILKQIDRWTDKAVADGPLRGYHGGNQIPTADYQRVHKELTEVLKKL